MGSLSLFFKVSRTNPTPGSSCFTLLTRLTPLILPRASKIFCVTALLVVKGPLNRISFGLSVMPMSEKVSTTPAL